MDGEPRLRPDPDDAPQLREATDDGDRDRPLGRFCRGFPASPHLRPFKDIPVGWRWRRAASIWANLPPATVWTLEQASHPSHLSHTHNGFH